MPVDNSLAEKKTFLHEENQIKSSDFLKNLKKSKIIILTKLTN